MAKKKAVKVVKQEKRSFSEVERFAMIGMASASLSYKSIAAKLGNTNGEEVKEFMSENNISVKKETNAQRAGLNPIKGKDGKNLGVVMTEGAAQRPGNVSNPAKSPHIFNIF